MRLSIIGFSHYKNKLQFDRVAKIKFLFNFQRNFCFLCLLIKVALLFESVFEYLGFFLF